MEQARDLAQAQTPKAPQPLPGALCATPDGGDVNTFLKEALATALQGNEDLREMVGSHKAVAMEAATRINEIEADRKFYFTNARDLTKHFREMQQRYKPSQEINLASLEALKERLTNKSGGHATTPTQQTNAARGEPGIEGISPNNLLHAPSGSETGPRTSLPQVPMPRTSTQTQALGRQGGLSVQTSGHANDNVPWPPHHQHANPDLALQPQAPEPAQGAGRVSSRSRPKHAPGYPGAALCTVGGLLLGGPMASPAVGLPF